MSPAAGWMRSGSSGSRPGTWRRGRCLSRKRADWWPTCRASKATCSPATSPPPRRRFSPRFSRRCARALELRTPPRAARPVVGEFHRLPRHEIAAGPAKADEKAHFTRELAEREALEEAGAADEIADDDELAPLAAHAHLVQATDRLVVRVVHGAADVAFERDHAAHRPPGSRPTKRSRSQRSKSNGGECSASASI